MDLSTQRIATKRLLLLPISEAWAEAIFESFTSEITTYMYPKPAATISETLDFIHHSKQGLSDGTNLQVVLLHGQTGEFIGCAGIHSLSSDLPELGIWIKKAAFGNKYGREAIGGLIEWAGQQARWAALGYPVDKRNIPSRRIPESFGGTIAKEFKHVNQSGFELDQVEYRIPLQGT